MSNVVEIKNMRHIPNIFGDGIAFVEEWDFSKGNMNNENRIHNITLVASICYQSPKALGSESLYNRLAAESHGLPSSSFEFVPVLLDGQNPKHHQYIENKLSNLFKFGEILPGDRYLLTNFRAMHYEYEQEKFELISSMKEDGKTMEEILPESEKLRVKWLEMYNTEEECKIIKEHFHVFLYNVDFPTRSQMVRHRVNIQELSRRYVSGERVGFEFYISEKMKNVTSTVEKEIWFEKDDGSEDTRTGIFNQTTQSIIDDCLAHYKQALADGVKPQEARRIIPQAAYTKLWMGFQPTQLDNFFKLRLDEHAQWEIRKVAEAMKKSVDAGLNDYIPTPEEEERICKRLEEYAEKGSDCLMSKEEVQSLLDQADENDINGAGNCDC